MQTAVAEARQLGVRVPADMKLVSTDTPADSGDVIEVVD